MKAFISTPIYYVNDIPHIGHAYTTIIADMLKKYKWLHNQEVFLLTGTDEHGQKIEQSAKAKGKSPQAYTDEISQVFRNLWDYFGIDYDYFIRTTDSYHKDAVAKVFEVMCENGDIYLGEYEGDYCVSCESFFTNVKDGICPDCAGNKPLSKIKEESYFFALSRYQDRLLQWYGENENIILPQHKKNEVIAFIQSGLTDLSISRTSFEWGVPLRHIFSNGKSDKKHIAYVWLDALFNYLSALGFNGEKNSTNWKMEYWQNATHIVGKDILRFHAVYWPAFLMSLNLPLPKHIYAHGWWMRDGQKMSKSIGNVINPKEFADAYGIEALRYYLLREASFGQDGDFSQKGLVERINSELGNELGNLLNRLLGMSEKYTQLTIESSDFESIYPLESKHINEIFQSIHIKMDSMQINLYIQDIWKALSLGNASITKYEPWNLYKLGKIKEINALLALNANLLLKASLCLYPIMPQTAKNIALAFGQTISPKLYNALIQNAQSLFALSLQKIPPLFPKIEALLIPESHTLESQNNVDSSAPKSKIMESKIAESKESKSTESKAHASATTNTTANTLANTFDGIALIDIADFSKIDIRVGEILSAEPVPKSTKLLKLQIDLGERESRTILSGIAQFYTPQELLHTQVCVIANLKPAKIMGQYSYGMILASKDEYGLSLLRIDKKHQNGSKVS